MPTPARKTPARKTAAATTRRSQPDAITLLRADHQAVSALFEQYAKARAASRKKSLVEEICKSLRVHTRIEEELFYPQVKPALKDHELVPEALVEHASLKLLIGQIEGGEPGGEDFEAKVQVLFEYVKHHVKEEQNELFPKVKATRLDLQELGSRLAMRKAELLEAGPETREQQPATDEPRALEAES
jgi:hemerythrin superfamily protein